MDTTRREMLRLSLLGMAATTSSSTFPAVLEKAEGKPLALGQIKSWATYGDQRFVAGPPIPWKAAKRAPGAETITLKPEQKFQEILGFGAAFTDAACYTFNRLSAEAREQLFHEMFAPSEMGLNVCRVCMGASDYSTKLYSYDDDGPDPDLAHFSLAHDREYILPMLREARKANPDLFLFGSPWSPPGWMKFNGSMLGGAMRRGSLAVYAQYFLKFLQGYAAEGVPVQAVTPQNEVDTDQDGRMPACIWPQEYEIEFVGSHLGPLLRQQGMGTQIWVLDHNYNLWGRAICELDDPALRSFCNGIAWHGYVGHAEMMSRVHQAYPEVGMHWTEGGPDYTNSDYATDWVKWGQTFISVLRNWCSSLTGWNLALDEQGRPNIGPFPCGGMVTIHSQSKEVTRSGQFWGMTHFARCIRRGARRFETQGTLMSLDHVAVENPDGGKVLVLSNAGSARTVSVQLGTMRADVGLEKDSLTTLTWA